MLTVNQHPVSHPHNHRTTRTMTNDHASLEHHAMPHDSDALGSVYAIFRAVAEEVRSGTRPANGQTANPTEYLP